jgi:hypothetical protein
MLQRAQRLCLQHARQRRLGALLCRLGGGEDFFDLQEVEDLEAAGAGVDIEIRVTMAQLLADDRALENEVAGEQRLPRFRRCLPRAARRRPADIDGDSEVGLVGDRTAGD